MVNYTSYSKRTIAANVTPIPIPEFLRGACNGNGIPLRYNSERYFHIFRMSVEGKDSDKKLVIKHNSVGSGANDMMVIPITGNGWDEFEKPSIENAFEVNFMFGEQHSQKERERLTDAKDYLINYLYEYFHIDPVGKRIMELVRKKSNEIHQKLERQDSPHSDKIIRETAEHILSKHHIVTVVETDEMFYYKDGMYVQGAEAIIEEECEGTFEYDMSNHLVQEIKGHIKRKSHKNRDEFDADPYVINFKNCLYDIKHNAIHEHKPEYLSLNQKPVNYDPSLKPKLYGKFLSQVLYPTQIRTMVELFAYTFYRSNPHEIFVNQFGYGANGKSVMMAVLKALHGPKNSSNLSLKQLIHDKFAVADLDGKDVNVDDEAAPGTIIDITKLKKLTGDQPTWVQRKNQQPYEVVLHAKHFFTSNELPDFTDMSEGRYRREIVVAYPNKFVRYPNPNNPEERKEDPYLAKTLTTEQELTGIASICMKVLRRILFQQEMRVYVDVRSIEDRRRHRELLRNPTKVFVEQVIDSSSLSSSSYSGTSDVEDVVFKDDLYKIYNHFCQLNKVPPLGKSAFSEKLRVLLGYPDRLRDGKEGKPALGQRTRRKFWKGITVREAWLNPDGKQQKSLLLEEDEEEIDILEEETERPLRPSQTPKNDSNQVERSDVNPITSDNSRSNIEDISSDTTNLAGRMK